MFWLNTYKQAKKVGASHVQLLLLVWNVRVLGCECICSASPFGRTSQPWLQMYAGPNIYTNHYINGQRSSTTIHHLCNWTKHQKCLNIFYIYRDFCQKYECGRVKCVDNQSGWMLKPDTGCVTWGHFTTPYWDYWAPCKEKKEDCSICIIHFQYSLLLPKCYCR